MRIASAAAPVSSASHVYCRSSSMEIRRCALSAPALQKPSLFQLLAAADIMMRFDGREQIGNYGTESMIGHRSVPLRRGGSMKNGDMNMAILLTSLIFAGAAVLAIFATAASWRQFGQIALDNIAALRTTRRPDAPAWRVTDGRMAVSGTRRRMVREVSPARTGAGGKRRAAA
ncbi:MAG: hypothetical protein ABW203_06090 [Novosphingobium sp.]